MTGVVKRVLRPERLRQVPPQFSWVDHALVQRRLIDRCDARSAALYLFLVTVADAQGLSYYGSATLAKRLGMSAEELAAARARLIEVDLLAYEAPLYQVLALPQGPPVHAHATRHGAVARERHATMLGVAHDAAGEHRAVTQRTGASP